MRNWADLEYNKAIENEIDRNLEEAMDIINRHIPKNMAKDFMEMLSLCWYEKESCAKRIARDFGLVENHFRAMSNDFDYFELVMQDYMNECRAESLVDDRAEGF